MKRIKIARDGHCLARAIFRGVKYQDLLPDIINYKSLLNECVQSLKQEIDTGNTYNVFYGDSGDSDDVAKKALDTYVTEKKYFMEHNILMPFCLPTLT